MAVDKNPPSATTVLVIGGGPGGSYAASVLAREGIPVVLLEADKFPRYHVGESQLASLRHFLRFIDLEEDFEAAGFTKKLGAAFKLNKTKREGYTDFVFTDPTNYSWNILRSQSDEMMLRHASKSGAHVFEETHVTDIQFEGNRPVSAQWKRRDGSTGQTSFKYLIDASGRAGVLSVKYFKDRVYNPEFKNVAFWTYWKGSGEYKPGTPRAGSPFFEALHDESGWMWFIPLHMGTSVGVVLRQDISDAKRKEAKRGGEDSSMFAHYMRQMEFAPTVKAMLADAEIICEPGKGPSVKTASDYSYHASSYAGPNYRIVGDAGAFIDPYLSSGVHLAISSGLSASASICSVLKGEVSEEDAIRFHSTKVHVSYTRFVLIIKSVYVHIRAQGATRLATDDEDNFDRAFAQFRSVIQGSMDAASAVPLNETRGFVEFLAKHAFEPSTPEERRDLLKRVGEPGQPSMSVQDDAILKSMAARQLLSVDETNHIDAYVADVVEGFRLRLKRGNLGLESATV